MHIPLCKPSSAILKQKLSVIYKYRYLGALALLVLISSGSVAAIWGRHSIKQASPSAVSMDTSRHRTYGQLLGTTLPTSSPHSTPIPKPSSTPTPKATASPNPTANTSPTTKVNTGKSNATAPTPTTTPAPTATPIPNTPPGNTFTTLGVGSALPSDASCAARVARSSWEPRPENAMANSTNIYTQGGRLTGSYLAQYGYEGRVTGNFTGTTDEILQWASCKWGIDSDIVRAQAVEEGYWRQSTLGDCGNTTVAETHGCASVGILQVKGADIPATHPGTWPYARQSTAFNADYTYGVWRACYEGKETWLGGSYHAGDAWGCLGRWYSGSWYDSAAQHYISETQGILASKQWQEAGF